MRLHLSCLFGPGVVLFIFLCFQTLSHFLINIKVWKEKGIMYRNSFISLWEERIGQLRLVLANHVLYNYSFSPNKNIVKAYSKAICKKRNVINQFHGYYWIFDGHNENESNEKCPSPRCIYHYSAILKFFNLSSF